MSVNWPRAEIKLACQLQVTCVEKRGDEQFIVLACDGIWDVMTNDDVANFVRYQMKLTNNLTDIANRMVDTCLHKVRSVPLSLYFLVNT